MDQLKVKIKDSYPCSTSYDCNFSGNIEGAFNGDKMRSICVSEETEHHGEDACRYENVKSTEFAIVRA